MSHSRPTKLSEADIERQIRFELRCVEEGAKKAREALMEQGLGESTIGMKLMRRLVKPLVTVIEEAQRQAADATSVPRRGRAANWWWPILTIDKHKLAVIILNAVFNAPPREGTSAFPISRVALHISNAVYQQIDFDAWEAAQKQLKRETEEPTELDEYLRTTKQIDLRSWKRFNEKLARTKLEKWSFDQGITFGVKCIDLLVQAKPEWFSVATNPIKAGRYETQLTLSEECRAVMFDLIEQEEVMSPRLLPMIIPPAPWRINPDKQKQGPTCSQ